MTKKKEKEEDVIEQKDSGKETEEELIDVTEEFPEEVHEDHDGLKKCQETLRKEEIKAQEYLDGWKRCQADFENYKKRQAESQQDMIRYATQGIILQIIPVLDNFHASTNHIPEDQKENAWVTGIMHIQKQLEIVLKDNGVENIDAKAGDHFDPKFHEAVEDLECKSCKTKDYKGYQNKIKRVVQKGYKIGEKVIRPARVIVE